MTYPVFMPPKNPSRGTDSSVTPKTAIANFGDNYSQRAAVGLNSVQDANNLVWEGLSADDAATIESFFRGLAGYQAFLWQAPWDSSQKKWYCPTWKRSWPNDAGVSQMTATLQQVFDL